MRNFEISETVSQKFDQENKIMKKSFLTLVCVFILAANLSAQTFTVKPNSPLAKGQHPRLFVTAEGVAAMRDRIGLYYKSDFQNFISALDKLYNTPAGTGAFSRWNTTFGAARSFALLYQVDPATINGVTAQRSRKEYGQKAITLGLDIAQRLAKDWTEAHHGASNLTTSEGGLASLALQVVYDWTHDLASLEQRRILADRLIVLWNNRYQDDKVKLENHWTANAHVYAGALCFYNDHDLGAFYTEKAKQMMDSFQDLFIERQLGVAANLFEGSSDWIEGDSYSMDAYISLMMLAGAAGSAVGENFFVSNSWLHDAPYYVYNSIMPMPYKGEYYFSQQNTSSGLTVRHGYPSAIMNMAAASLKDADPNLAGFAAWFCENSPYGREVDTYRDYAPHLYDFFYKFIFGTKQVQKKSPEEAGISLSSRLGQMHAMRSAHASDDATLIHFFSPQFWYQNGHNEEEIGAFNVHRFGPLAISAANSKNVGIDIPRVTRGGKSMSQNNVFGLGPDKELALETGAKDNKADLPQHFLPGTHMQIGEVEARAYQPNWYDYVNYNYTRSYKAGKKATLARRALVYLRGQVNQEFVVILDRVASAQKKHFVLHTPVDIEAVDGEWSAISAGQWKNSGRTVKVTNRIDRAHGQMYLTSVLPQNATMYKFGGPGYEWVAADGSPLVYRGSFNEAARYLFSDHTLHIQSPENLFLTAMQIGDANTMGAPAAVESVSGANFVGVLLGQERLVIFNKDEQALKNFSYTIASSKAVQHLLAGLEKNYQYTVISAGKVIASGTTGENGVITFADHPRGSATYSVVIGSNAVSNQPPQAVVTANPPAGVAPLAVKFAGSSSSDPDGNITSYAWDFGDGTSANVANPQHLYSRAGIYKATLKVIDNGGLSSSASLIITVTTDNGGNQPPAARIDSPQVGEKFITKERIRYSGDAVDQEDGAVALANFTWQLILPDGSVKLIATGKKSGQEKISKIGRHTLQCIVKDSQGLADTAEIHFEVLPKPRRTSVAVSSNVEASQKYTLEQNWPNPFNPTTSISFHLRESGRVRLNIYNSIGQQVAAVLDEVLPAGFHTRRLNAQQWPSGRYFYALEVNGFREVKSLILAK
jgi:PKD repeat protein